MKTEDKRSPANLKDLIGQRFGMLKVVARFGSSKYNRAVWLCKCDCGNEKNISSNLLLSGHTRSCGCFGYKSNIERLKSYRTKHNKRHTRLYTIWRAMKERCYVIKSVSYDKYGGRGVCVCDEWKNSFVNFYNWAIDNGYSDEKLSNGKYKYSIERIDNNGNYEPSNCKWATIEEQANNKSNNRLITYNGETKTVAQWARYFNIEAHLIYCRLYRGWSVEKTLTTPKMIMIRRKEYENQNN